MFFKISTTQLDRCICAPIKITLIDTILRHLYPLILPLLVKMGKYTEEHIDEDKNNKKYTLILEEGHFTKSNANTRKFEFSEPKDITADLDKRNAKHPNPNVPNNPGRTGLINTTVVYPNGERSAKCVFTECVLQYRENMNTENGQEYGATYVNVGIPKVYIDLVLNHAKLAKRSVTLRDRVRQKSDHYWIDCDLKDLSTTDISIYYADENSDEAEVVNMGVRETLQKLKKNIKATITFSITCSMTNRDKTQDLPLQTGTFNLSIKPKEITMITDSDVEAPDLSEFATQVKDERSEKGETSLAGGLLLDMVLGRLKIA